VIAAVEEQHHGRPVSEVVEGVEEGLAEVAGRPRATAVQEDERPVPVLRRHDADLVQVAVHEAAVQRVVLDPSAASRPVTADQVADNDVAGDRQDGDHD
jgi:hypothetical protein